MGGAGQGFEAFRGKQEDNAAGGGPLQHHPRRPRAALPKWPLPSCPEGGAPGRAALPSAVAAGTGALEQAAAGWGKSAAKCRPRHLGGFRSCPTLAHSAMEARIVGGVPLADTAPLRCVPLRPPSLPGASPVPAFRTQRASVQHRSTASQVFLPQAKHPHPLP